MISLKVLIMCCYRGNSTLLMNETVFYRHDPFNKAPAAQKLMCETTNSFSRSTSPLSKQEVNWQNKAQENLPESNPVILTASSTGASGWGYHWNRFPHAKALRNPPLSRVDRANGVEERLRMQPMVSYNHNTTVILALGNSMTGPTHQ